ncbi:ABC transporter, ATP-binding protein [marine gamma proteobacterium HTCC2148]|uniref:ABC transporter, ATP-binding protein n=1 Tax=uncultured marine bacterium 463 TaxID=257394 RepID=Q6SGV3_9BACT|nr:ABC transporter, ATP-binding protein [uncultured marine bacterium 463]EEB79495.1 ABC transporter, ATP-binding protein [marine gamma proteobacterium HTCC2148]
MNFRTLLSYITPPKVPLLICAVLMLGGTCISLINPLVAGELTRKLLGEANTSGYSTALIILAWGALFAARSLLELANGYYLGLVGERMATELRNRVYEHMQLLPLPWHQARRRGQVLTLLSNDTDMISDFVTGTVLPLLPTSLTLLGAFVMMASLDPSIAILVTCGMPLYVLLLKIIGRKMRPLSRTWVDQYSELISRAEENLSLLAAIKSFSRERLEREAFRQENQQLERTWQRQLKLQTLLSPAVDLLAGVGVLTMLWLGSRHIEQGLLDPAELVSLLLYANLLIAPLRSLADVYGRLQQARGAAERLLELFSEQPEPLNDGGTPLPPVKGSIVFTGVKYAYPERKPLFEHLNLIIDAGETVAITGENGAGKSTIAHLLMRLIPASAGRILIDGHDISTAELSSVRAQVGLVAQHVLLLNGTIADNIAYSRPGASQEDIRKAAHAAHAADFIEALPQQYETIIGDEGIKLSGGQRQRLSLARTLLKDPPILILDEATSMFDPEGEASFISECHDLIRQRTVVLITHRPASLALADRILRLEDGELAPTLQASAT